MNAANDTTVRRLVALRCGYPLSPFPASIRTPHGQNITLIEPSGRWVCELRVEDICVGSQTVAWGECFVENNYLEWIIRAFAIWRLQRAIRVRPLVMMLQAAAMIRPSSDAVPHINVAIRKWIADVDSDAAHVAGPDLKEGMLAFLEYCVAMRLPGADATTLNFARDSLRCSYGRIKVLRRPGEPPFTVSEVAEIDQAIRTSDAITARSRALLLVARDTGIRPIQIALLVWNDLQLDALGPYLDVPSVKGRIRSKQRRSNGNFRRRYLSDMAATALEAYRADSKRASAILFERVRAIVGIGCGAAVNLPIFPHMRSDFRTAELSGQASLAPYVLHSTAGEISMEIRRTTLELNVASGADGSAAPLLISATRMRRTKATSLVLQGCSAAEIAEAMDHRSTSSLKSYFLYSKDINDIVRSSRFGTAEIELAAERWSGKIIKHQDNIASEMQGRPILDLGVCMQTEDCSYWPTVTCYACARFRPYAEADHLKAQAHIISARNEAASNSTGPFARMFDNAVEGVAAVIHACGKTRNKKDDER